MLSALNCVGHWIVTVPSAKYDLAGWIRLRDDAAIRRASDAQQKIFSALISIDIPAFEPDVAPFNVQPMEKLACSIFNRELSCRK
jgi:hypothetical protein